MTENTTTSGASLPPVVLSNIFLFLSPRPGLISAHLVCKEWLNVLRNNPAVQHWFHLQLLKEYAPHYAVHSSTLSSFNDIPDLKRLYIQYRNLVEIEIPELWLPTSSSNTDDESFRESMQMSRHTRWVLDHAFDKPSFIVDLAWTVRVLYCLGPNGYNVVDGANYYPHEIRQSLRASNTASGWRLVPTYARLPDNVLPQLLFDETEFSGLAMLKHIVRCGGANTVEYVLEQSPDLSNHPDWSRAMDLSQHIRLLQFLVTEPNALRGLFWDANGVIICIVHCLAKAYYPRWWKEEHKRSDVPENDFHRQVVGSPNPRQLPHLFNMFKLAKHVEELGANDELDKQTE